MQAFEQVEQFEQRCLLVGRAGRLGKERLHLIAQQISDRDETPRPGPRALGRLHGGVAAYDAGQQ